MHSKDYDILGIILTKKSDTDAPTEKYCTLYKLSVTTNWITATLYDTNLSTNYTGDQ